MQEETINVFIDEQYYLYKKLFKKIYKLIKKHDFKLNHYLYSIDLFNNIIFYIHFDINNKANCISFYFANISDYLTFNNNFETINKNKLVIKKLIKFGYTISEEDVKDLSIFIDKVIKLQKRGI